MSGHRTGGKMLNVLDLKSGRLEIKHADGRKTEGSVEVRRRFVKIGCFAISKRALRQIIPRLQEAAG